MHKQILLVMAQHCQEILLGSWMISFTSETWDMVTIYLTLGYNLSYNMVTIYVTWLQFILPGSSYNSS